MPRTWGEMTVLERKRVLDWLVETCLVHGSQEYTAYRVAAEFARGLEQEVDHGSRP